MNFNKYEKNKDILDIITRQKVGSKIIRLRRDEKRVDYINFQQLKQVEKFFVSKPK